MNKVSWMKMLSALLVVAAACGTDRAGGETHWVACESPIECETGFDCVEGKCIPEGSAGGEAGGGGSPGTGGRPETGGAPATGGTETGGAAGEAGAGGTLGCVPGDRGFAGAIFIEPGAPSEGKLCPEALEGFELCSPVYELGAQTNTVLSRCVDQNWMLVEDPSECEPSLTTSDDCNWPTAFTGMCCSGARYCARFDAVCDGEQWYR